MKTRMWIVKKGEYGIQEAEFYVDDPAYIHRVGEFIDGYNAGGWVDHVQWNYTPVLSDDSREEKQTTVYVYLRDKKDA